MKLFEPAKIGQLVLKNRIAMAPISIAELAEPDGTLSPRGIDYYVARAQGGTGLIITCGVRVTHESRRRHLRVDGTTNLAWLNKLADAVHSYGAKIAMLLSAGHGRVGNPIWWSKGGMVAPSPLPCFWDPSIRTREITVEEIKQLVQAFGRTAEIASANGVDAIGLHGHEGYLLDQFKTALWNKRTDKYGGDIDGRLRFSTEIIQAIKKGAGADFPVIYRFGLTHHLEGGREIEEGLEIARRLEAAGVDALDVDAGCYETWYWPHPPSTQPPGCMVDMAEMAKKVVKIPVMAVGKLGNPDLAERVLQEGKADFIILGRPLLTDPEWPNKVRDGRLEDIRPCIGDHECLNRVFVGQYISCTVNPACGMEKEFTIKPAERKKEVLVVGGGPAGLEAARVAALRGHKVTLWEKADALGGNLIPASIPDFKQDYRGLITYLSTQVKKLGVKVELGREATVKSIQQFKPDVVVIATGSTPIIPDIPGVKRESVVTATELLLARKAAGKSVIVIGGGHVGCETALYLANKGKKVTVVEMLDKVMSGMCVANYQHLMKLLADANVDILIDTNVLEITDEGAIVGDKVGKKRSLVADTVVLAVGFRSKHELSPSLTGVPEAYAVGDCVQPRKVIDAIWEGFGTARLF